MSQYAAIEYMTRGKGTIRSPRGRCGLGGMWKIPYRGPLAYSVDGVLRLLFCQQFENHLAPLFIHFLLSSQESSQEKRKILRLA